MISAGKVGAYGITPKDSAFAPAQPVEVKSTAGAGDSLLGGVLVGLAIGMPFICSQAPAQMIESALQLGVLVGSFKCLSPHTIHPEASLDALIDFGAQRGLTFSAEFQRCIVDAYPAPSEHHVPRSRT